MVHLQASKIQPKNISSNSLRFLLHVNTLALMVTIVLNFLGSPALKYTYLFHILITFFAILKFEFSDILPILLTLLFIEGQGRIIWGKEGWTIIIFDVLMLIGALKIFITNKKIIDFSVIPKPLIIFAALFFSWYILELSNPNSLSFFASVASSKIYIYPLLLFFGLAQVDFNISRPQFQKGMNFFIFLLVLELALTFYQFAMKESLVIQISPFYQFAMKNQIFTGSFYRAFATTFSPGAIAAYFYLTVGFLYFKKKSRFEFIVRIVTISALTVSVVMSQVRSALIKFVLIILLIQLGEIIYQRFKAKAFIGLTIFSFIFFYGFLYIADADLKTGDEGLENIRQRFTSIGNVQTLKAARLSIPKFFQVASQKLIEKPLGIGPGLTGSVGSLSADEIKQSHFLNKEMIWAFDNLFLTLLIDFGVGAIFYLLIIFYIPFYFARYMFIFYIKKSEENYKNLLICFSSLVTIIFGNWGAVGITYNPESFIFWFFAAVGFSTIGKYKKAQIIDE